MDVFEAFPTQQAILYLRISHTSGDQLGDDYIEDAVFKQRQGVAQTGEKDTRTGDATLYLKPSSAFVAASGGNMVGSYAKIDGNLYRITSWSEGKDFDTAEVKHYRLDMERKDESSWAQSSILE